MSGKGSSCGSNREAVMQEALFREYCRMRRFDTAAIEAAVQAVMEFEDSLAAQGTPLETVTSGDLAGYLSTLIRSGQNTEDRLLAIARYLYVMKKNELFIELALIIEAPGILPTVREHARDVIGDAAADAVFDSLELPPEGSPLAAYPAVTAELLRRLQRSLAPETCREVLTGNMHRIPVEEFADMVEHFRASPDVDALLEYRHTRLVADLEEHMHQSRLWYEQEITPEVLDLVRNDREIQSGVRKGNTIYVSKIPFNPAAYLHETDPVRKRFYACHCPLARSSILTGMPAVPPLLCRCSAGYEKLPFDAIFGEPVQIEVLESVLAGDTRCRFAVTIPDRFCRAGS
jgi:hypothetical protein